MTSMITNESISTQEQFAKATNQAKYFLPLIAAKYPWTVVGLIPHHSSVNLVAVKFLKKSVVAVELFIAVVGTVLFAVGLSIYN